MKVRMVVSSVVLGKFYVHSCQRGSQGRVQNLTTSVRSDTGGPETS